MVLGVLGVQGCVEKFQIICEDTLEEGLKFAPLFCVYEECNSITVAPKIVSC